MTDYAELRAALDDGSFDFDQRAHMNDVRALLAERDAFREALQEALTTIQDYLDYDHDGDPWSEDARAMCEMDINDYATDGRMARARTALAQGEV